MNGARPGPGSLLPRLGMESTESEAHCHIMPPPRGAPFPLCCPGSTRTHASIRMTDPNSCSAPRFDHVRWGGRYRRPRLSGRHEYRRRWVRSPSARHCAAAAAAQPQLRKGRPSLFQKVPRCRGGEYPHDCKQSGCCVLMIVWHCVPSPSRQHGMFKNKAAPQDSHGFVEPCTRTSW